MAVKRYAINTINWGTEQSAGGSATALTLAATGAGVWAVVDIHETIRMGAFDFQTGIDVTHEFVVRARYTTYIINAMQFRIRDLTNSLTIATVSFTVDSEYASSQAFSNLPAANALIQLQYSLAQPAGGTFNAGLWEMNRWS